MMHSVTRREVTLREASDERGISYDVLRSWRQWRPDFPEKSRMAGRTALYFDSDITAFLRRNPTLGKGVGWNRRRDVPYDAMGEHPPDHPDDLEVVTIWGEVKR